MFVFVLSSRRPRPRTLPQDLLTCLFCAWFCTKDLCFVLLRVGRGLLAILETHRPWHDATGLVFFLPTKCLVGRYSLRCIGFFCVLSRPFIWPVVSFFGRCPLSAFLRHCSYQLCQLECTNLSSILVNGGLAPLCSKLLGEA